MPRSSFTVTRTDEDVFLPGRDELPMRSSPSPKTYVRYGLSTKQLLPIALFPEWYSYLPIKSLCDTGAFLHPNRATRNTTLAICTIRIHPPVSRSQCYFRELWVLCPTFNYEMEN